MQSTAESRFQCANCQFQSRFRAKDGSIAFQACGHPDLEPIDAAYKYNPQRQLLARICLRDAQRGECLQFEPLVIEEGSYLSEDIIPDLPDQDCSSPCIASR